MLRSVRRYRQLAIVTTVGICILVVAGGIVRLTGSGLGCDDWPNCNSERFVDVSSGHTAIEQVNRLLSGVIGIPTLLLAISSVRARFPEAPDRRINGLRVPAFGVLASILANGVVGGIAVRGDLHPALVQSHFLLAMLSIAFGMVAVRRATDLATDVRQPTDIGRASDLAQSDLAQSGLAQSGDQQRRALGVRRLAVGLGVLTSGALATGTVVTGTGPHAGEEDVRRFGFDISHVARIHSVTVISALIVGLALAWALRRDVVDDGGSRSHAIDGLLSAWIFVGLLQGAVGYTQYFNGVPELLVGVHIALATALWVITVRLVDRAMCVSAMQQDATMVTGVLADA